MAQFFDVFRVETSKMNEKAVALITTLFSSGSVNNVK